LRYAICVTHYTTLSPAVVPGAGSPLPGDPGLTLQAVSKSAGEKVWKLTGPGVNQRGKAVAQKGQARHVHGT